MTDENEIKKQIRNTVILRYFFDKNESVIKLKKVIEGTQYGYNASALESGQNKFLRISDITDGKVNWDTVPFCDCTDEETYLLNTDDLLIARTGGTTGKSFLIKEPPANSIYAGYLIRIRANEDTNPEFLNLFLNSYAYWSQIVSLNEGEFRPSVNANKLKDLILPTCSADEQADAVRISNGETVPDYAELSIKIEKALKSYENCKSILVHTVSQKRNTHLLKQSILQEAIQGKLTEEWRKQNPEVEPASELLQRIKAEKAQLIKDKVIKKEKPLPPITAEEIPFVLPEGWVWCRLGEIIVNAENLDIQKKLNSKTIINYVDIDAIDNKNQVIREAKELPVRELSSRARRILKKGQILYSLVRPYLHNLAIVQEDKPNHIGSTGFAVFDCIHINNQYIFWVLLSKYIEDLYLSYMDGFNSPSITHDQFRNTITPLAPVSEQKTIVQKVETLMEKCRALESEITQSEQHAQMLMQAVLKEAFLPAETPVQAGKSKPVAYES